MAQQEPGGQGQQAALGPRVAAGAAWEAAVPDVRPRFRRLL